ncbi:MAG: hypothetical protein AMS19_05445, partial [Gemmatimonas sp. SG8_23]
MFTDGFGPNVDYQAFGDSKVDAVSVDPTERRSGTSSLRVTVPSPTDPAGGYAGGAFVGTIPRDLTGYNALTFWARASIPVTLNTAGLGNDNTGTSIYTTEADGGVDVSTAWTKFTLPIPNPAVLGQEGGLFYFAEASENGTTYDIWFDDIQFELLGTLANPRPSIPTETRLGTVGSSFAIDGARYTVDVAGTDVTMNASPAYFSFTSSDTDVATVDETGTVTLVGAGTATITASLAGTSASGAITLDVIAPPAEAAPTPTTPEADVISLFSNAYTGVPVDAWASFGNADVADTQVAGDDVKLYTNLASTFEGIEFVTQTVDATDMNRFRMDIWTPDATDAPAVFRVKLVDFGADGAFGGGDDSEHELIFSATSTPALATGSWVSLDVPLSAFAGLASRANLAQIILSGDLGTVYVDN